MRRPAGSFVQIFLAFALLFAGGAAQAAAQAGGQPMMLPVHPDPLVVDEGQESPEFSIEVADDDQERSSGLMFRRDLPRDRGMLFIFPQTRQVAFWMKNTPLPLDLVFIGEDGRVVDILPGTPFSEAPIAPGEPVRFVLELNRGTAASTGIGIGDRLRHPEIDVIAGSD